MKNFYLFIYLILTLSIFGQDKFPELRGHVNDYASILTQTQSNELETTLSTYEKNTSIQIVIVTIKSLNDESIEEYTNELANYWKIGQSEIDNGLVILVSLEDRQWRIETGYGLEAYLPDIICADLGENITDNFKKQQYFEGLRDVVNSTINWLGTFSDEDKAEMTKKIEEKEKMPTWQIILIALIIILIFIDIAANGGDALTFAIILSFLNSGGSSGGSSGGGGFSGGGGSFGGGGSSGSW